MRVWIVRFGQMVKRFYTHYHAAQYCRALELNGTKYTLHVTEE